MKNHIFTLFVIAFALFFISKANAQTNSIVVKKDTVTAYEGDSLIVDMIKNDYSTDGGTIKITGIFKNPMHTYFIKYNANEIHLYVPYVFKDYSPYLFKVKDTLIVKITDTINNTFSRDTLIINILNNDKKLNYIDINNVKAFFKNGFIIPYLPTLYKLLPKQYSLGDFCTYKVPKDSSTSTILYAELWVGGLDNNNNPRLMGTTYDPDYFRYGPLTTDG
ncbi:MAG: hypothetical protein Q8880_08805, partial [Bacteroidota bacterium]|nr:hypothetical protein [Bacteroidota bacterium]